MTAVNSPEGLDSGTIVKEFRNTFSAVVANGQGDAMKDKLFRIAHIGYYDYLDTVGILGALEHVIARVTGRQTMQQPAAPLWSSGATRTGRGRARHRARLPHA